MEQVKQRFSNSIRVFRRMEVSFIKSSNWLNKERLVKTDLNAIIPTGLSYSTNGLFTTLKFCVAIIFTSLIPCRFVKHGIP